MDVKGCHEVPSKAEEILAIMTARSEESVFFWDVTSLSVAFYVLIPIHIQAALCGFSGFKIKEHKKLEWENVASIGKELEEKD